MMTVTDTGVIRCLLLRYSDVRTYPPLPGRVTTVPRRTHAPARARTVSRHSFPRTPILLDSVPLRSVVDATHVVGSIHVDYTRSFPGCDSVTFALFWLVVVTSSNTAFAQCLRTQKKVTTAFPDSTPAMLTVTDEEMRTPGLTHAFVHYGSAFTWVVLRLVTSSTLLVLRSATTGYGSRLLRSIHTHRSVLITIDDCSRKIGAIQRTYRKRLFTALRGGGVYDSHHVLLFWRWFVVVIVLDVLLSCCYETTFGDVTLPVDSLHSPSHLYVTLLIIVTISLHYTHHHPLYCSCLVNSEDRYYLLIVIQ